jgi:hypothetical protein
MPSTPPLPSGRAPRPARAAAMALRGVDGSEPRGRDGGGGGVWPAGLRVLPNPRMGVVAVVC